MGKEIISKLEVLNFYQHEPRSILKALEFDAVLSGQKEIEYYIVGIFMDINGLIKLITIFVCE